MIIKKRSRFLDAVRQPEAQFFILFALLFGGFFLVNYFNLPEAWKYASVVAGISVFLIVLLQTIYSASAHAKIKKEENNFISVSAHQMRAPLTALRWILEEFKRKNLTEAEKLDYLRMAQMATGSLGETVDAFSEIAKIEDGYIDYRFENFDIVVLAEKLIREVEPIAKQHSVIVHLNRPTKSINVFADPIKLAIAFSNLIHNAIKYNYKGGSVLLSVRELEAGNLVEISIKDSGLGISPDDKMHLFEKYYRAEEARKLNSSGTGLGLYLVKQIISQHKGKVWVESVHGKGSTFYITLPIQAK